MPETLVQVEAESASDSSLGEDDELTESPEDSPPVAQPTDTDEVRELKTQILKLKKKESQYIEKLKKLKESKDTVQSKYDAKKIVLQTTTKSHTQAISNMKKYYDATNKNLIDQASTFAKIANQARLKHTKDENKIEELQEELKDMKETLHETERQLNEEREDYARLKSNCVEDIENKKEAVKQAVKRANDLGKEVTELKKELKSKEKSLEELRKNDKEHELALEKEKNAALKHKAEIAKENNKSVLNLENAKSDNRDRNYRNKLRAQEEKKARDRLLKEQEHQRKLQGVAGTMKEVLAMNGGAFQVDHGGTFMQAQQYQQVSELCHFTNTVLC